MVRSAKSDNVRGCSVVPTNHKTKLLEALTGWAPKSTLSRARRVKTVNLGAIFARAANKRPSATLAGNCQLGSLTTGSPAGHLRERGFKGPKE